MEGLLSADRLLALWDTVYGWLLTNVFVLDNAVQVGVVGLTLLLAMLFAKRVKPWLARYREHRSVGRGVVIAESLAMPVVWLALLWLAMTVVGLSERPNALLRTAVTLLAAWIAIHLASQFVRNPRLGQAHRVGCLVDRGAQHPRPARADDRRARLRGHSDRRRCGSRSTTS